VDTNKVLITKFEMLDEHINFLKEIGRLSLEEFIHSKRDYGSAERFLHISIEILIDVGNHIISQNGWESAHWYQDIATIFQEKGYIDSELCAIWIKMIKFRNLLVHEYAKIDKKEVYKVLQNHLDDLVKIQKMFVVSFL
jgi:uncharacterized protein YutE (UPF0331/DUF86 family)